MTTVLFIKANDRPASQAVSSKMYETFLNTYKEANPNDTITELDVFAEEIPNYGHTAITGVFKRNQGLDTTADEAAAADLVDQYVNQLFAADKIVLAFPLWNGMVPAPLVNYISYLTQAGRTFKYTPEGAVGLVEGKKVILLNARGGIYSTEPAASSELALKFVANSLALMGVKNPETVIIEGHNQYPDRAQDIIADGLEEVAKAAAKF